MESRAAEEQRVSEERKQGFRRRACWSGVAGVSGETRAGVSEARKQELRRAHRSGGGRSGARASAEEDRVQWRSIGFLSCANRGF